MRDRTADLLNAIQALSQLSYTPYPNISAQKVFILSIFLRIHILIRKNRRGPLVTRLPSHQKNAPFKYYMIPEIIVFRKSCAMMAAKFSNFEVC